MSAPRPRPALAQNKRDAHFVVAHSLFDLVQVSDLRRPGLRAEVVAIIVEHFQVAGVRCCTRCACTEERGCPPDDEGRSCSWATENRCTRCAP